MVSPSVEHLEAHYADLKTKGFFAGLIKYMNSGPVVAMVWEGRDVVKTGRAILGATKPSDSAPGTIRFDYAVDVGRVSGCFLFCFWVCFCFCFFVFSICLLFFPALRSRFTEKRQAKEKNKVKSEEEKADTETTRVSLKAKRCKTISVAAEGVKQEKLPFSQFQTSH